jgi:hypothetical protein
VKVARIVLIGAGFRILPTALILMCAVLLDAAAPLSMTVSPAQSFAPTTLTIRVHVEPDPANRVLEVIAESGEYYRSSQMPIDGADASHTVSFELRDVPGGDYDVTCILINDAGRERATVRRHVRVVESGGSDEGRP